MNLKYDNQGIIFWSRLPHCQCWHWVGIYRVTQKVSDLGWVDLELGSSPGRWAGTMVTYCPSRMVEHLKSKST